MGKNEEVRKIGAHLQMSVREMKAMGGRAHHLQMLVCRRDYSHINEWSFVKEVDRGSHPFTNERSWMGGI